MKAFCHQLLGRMASTVIGAQLRSQALRQRMAFQLKQRHFDELDLQIPVGGGLVCPLAADANRLSFGEIFCEQEYAGVFDHIAPPRKWLDLGAHAGFFSLYVASQHVLHRSAGDWSALLVEPDPRMGPALDRLIAINDFGSRMQRLSGAIGPADGTLAFALRFGMASSSAPAEGHAERVIDVPVVTEHDLSTRLQPPYDLIKLDIEGAEYAFVQAYRSLCTSTRAIVIEWHGKTAEDPRIPALRETLRTYGLDRVIVLRSPKPVCTDGSVTGLELFLRTPRR